MSDEKVGRVRVIDPKKGPTTGKKYASARGTVLRRTPNGYIEVALDWKFNAGTGLVSFRPDELEEETS